LNVQERYSTPGGAQDGIDIIDLSGQEQMRAAQTRVSEILSEIQKAKAFAPLLAFT
jgi:hypothetical protein